MGEDEYNPPITIGRLFLSTVKVIIYNGTKEVHVHFSSDKVRRYFTDPNHIVEDSKQVRMRRGRRNRNQRRQIIKDGWADYEGEVVRSEDILLEQNYPEKTVAPSQVCREKIVIHEEQAPSEPPTTPSSESQDESENGESRSEDLKTLNALPRGKLGSYIFPFNYFKIVCLVNEVHIILKRK